MFPCTYRTVTSVVVWMASAGPRGLCPVSSYALWHSGLAALCHVAPAVYVSCPSHRHAPLCAHVAEYLLCIPPPPTRPLQVLWKDLKLLLAYRPELQENIAVEVGSPHPVLESAELELGQCREHEGRDPALLGQPMPALSACTQRALPHACCAGPAPAVGADQPVPSPLGALTGGKLSLSFQDLLTCCLCPAYRILPPLSVAAPGTLCLPPRLSAASLPAVAVVVAAHVAQPAPHD